MGNPHAPTVAVHVHVHVSVCLSIRLPSCSQICLHRESGEVVARTNDDDAHTVSHQHGHGQWRDVSAVSPAYKHTAQQALGNAAAAGLPVAAVVVVASASPLLQPSASICP